MMKQPKLTIPAMAALLMAALAACSGEDDQMVAFEASPLEKEYTLSVETTKGIGAVVGDLQSTTRALTQSGSTLAASWATTDRVYVQNGGTWATGSLQPQTAGATATLKGSLTGVTIAAADVLTLQFPKSGTPDYSGQKGTLEDIAANYDYATATATIRAVSANGMVAADATTFTNQQAIVRFTLFDDTDGTTPVNATNLTVSDGTNTYTVNPAAATNDLYVAMPGFSGQTVSLNATSLTGFFDFEKVGVTFTNGQYYEVTVKMTKKPTDLSMVDCAGNWRASQWTANCYMVHTAGDYKLPLVYGNAIKNGATNAAAYTGVSGSNTTTTFPNHAGNAINAPWITKSTSGSGVDKGMGITVATAELIWQDAKGLITAVGIDGDYLTLTVGKDATTQEGNALVAAKDADGNIVWSWHIWVTKQTFATLTTVNTDKHTYSLTPVNLGWVGSATSSKGYNTYYQWGRKDAFIPSTGTSSTNHTVYNISNTSVTGLTYTPSTTATIADNIKNPTTLYYNKNSDNTGPCNTTYYNMWDAKQSKATENIATATVKTVYDPSPPGFCVPTGNLYYYIKNGSGVSFIWNDTNKGRNLTFGTTNVFFPASGKRGNSTSLLSLVGSEGNCWSASASNSYSAREFYFDSSDLYITNCTRSLGAPVRAVAE